MKKLFFIIMMIFTTQLHAAIIYVNTAATGANNGASWTNAYTNLEMAMLFAVSGDEVWVAKGTYKTSATNDRNSSFVLNNGVTLYGNFFGNETNINQRTGLTPAANGADRINETILSGDIGIANDSTDNANHVVYIVNNTLPVIIDGVKVIKGNAILTVGKGKGGGIYIENVGSVALRNVIVMNNTATPGLDGKGAGVYINNATLFVMENAAVISNRIIDDAGVSGSAYYYGGGLFLNCPQNQISNAFFENNKVVSNRSNIEGGGIYISNNVKLSVTNTNIKNNLINSTTTSATKYLYGGGLICYGTSTSVATLTLTDISLNLITTARAYTYGAGSYINTDTLKVIDCSINDNQITNTYLVSGFSNQGGGMYAYIAKRATFTNSTFNRNRITARTSSGGGLYLVSATDTCSINNCRFLDNVLQSSNGLDGSVVGGGLYTSCKAKISNSKLSRNTVTISSYTASNLPASTNAYGGGIATFAYASIRNCMIDSNYLEASGEFDYYTMSNPTIVSRAYGGGVYSTSRIDLLNTRVSDNYAVGRLYVTQLWTSYFTANCYGGGVYNDFTTSGQKSSIRNCIVKNNDAMTYLNLANGDAKGGGIYSRNMDIMNNEISDNETYVDIAVSGGLTQGGGILHNGTGKIYNNTITNNAARASTSYQSGGYTSNAYGGGIYSNSTDTIANCLIHNNRVVARNKSYGGGLYNRGASKIANLTIAENHSYSELNTRNGSGVFMKTNTAQMLNSVIYFNDLLDYYDSTTTCLVKNCVIQLYQSGGGNFNINPQFADTAANDFHVSAASIAIDRGDSTYVPKPVRFDLDGNKRISGINVDMGTYELDQCKNTSAIFHTICQGNSYLFNGQNLTLPGIYKDTLTNHAGCDSTVTLTLSVGATSAFTDVKTACDSYTWINGTTYTTNNNSATYILQNHAGCDSIITLNLTINYSNASTHTVTACNSYTWINGITYTANNTTATHTLTNHLGCDSVVTLHLTINYSNASIHTVTACNSYTWINGVTYTANNTTATHTLTNHLGCDSVVTLHLTINHSNASTHTVTACNSYTWINGITYTANNTTATHTLTNYQGCDSVVTLHLTINHSNASIHAVTACNSYTWINGITYTANNTTATHTLTNHLGCDSVVTLHLTINHSNASTHTVTACNSYTWINGITYIGNNNSATHILQNHAGCDSVITLNLTINHSNASIHTVTACNSYTWINGITYTANNTTAIHTLTNHQGCDSVVTLHLTINHSNASIHTVTACNSYTWINGMTYTANNTTATHTLTNHLGCDSVVTLHLTINPSNASTHFVTACNSYTWINGVTYTANNTNATHTLINHLGCDSVVTLHLTINPSNASTHTVTACNSYTWINGITYTANNTTATHTLTNHLGCDSVVTLHLTINYSNASIHTVTACNSYTWINGITYTANNTTATHTLTNHQGCDSVVTLHLTINPSNASTHFVTACNSYTWINGITYTANNTTATHTLTNHLGCDSVVTLHLAINHSNASTHTVTACNSYTWINGITYTANNTTATHTLTNHQGCDSVVTLHLTINQSNASTHLVTACNSYTWINGITYTANNTTATHTLTNHLGCDSVVTLHLTINHSNASTHTVTACNSYTWINGITYTANNTTATHTLTNHQGCDSVVTLHLTINQSNASTHLVTACNSYTWINGITYTANNTTATHTLTNHLGCDSVVSLHLTINPSNASTHYVTACNSYTWINGITYTANNTTATHTLTNHQGCDSVVTLHLTINQSNASTHFVTTCNSYTWINGITYTANNTNATHTLTNHLGCDSVVTLHLTVNHVNAALIVNGLTLTATTPAANYQWLDCNNAYQPIANEVNQSFTATANGNYAVIVTVGSCSDTSTCENILTVGIDNTSIAERISVYPNPNQGQFTIDLDRNAKIIVLDALGRRIFSSEYNSGKFMIDLNDAADGVYIVKAISGDKQYVVRMVITK